MDRIDSDNHVVDSDGNRKFRDSYLPATIMSADFLNAVQEELVGIIEAAGLFPSPSDRTQLTQALRARTRWAVDENTGSSNEFIFTLDPAILEYEDGLLIKFLPVKDNEPAPIYANVNGLGNREIRFAGGALGYGKIQAGIIARIVYLADSGWFEFIASGKDYL